MLITKQFLAENPECIFVFGDNLLRKGKKGGAYLRDCPNTYGFITKKYPSWEKSACYYYWEYRDIYAHEIAKLKRHIKSNPEKCYLISKIGGALANAHGIWEKVIEPNIKRDLKSCPNVVLLWEVDMYEPKDWKDITDEGRPKSNDWEKRFYDKTLDRLNNALKVQRGE